MGILETNKKEPHFSRLSSIRKFFGYTQKDIAQMLNVDVMVISLIERGVTKMKKEYEKVLEKEFNMPPGAFTNEYVLPVPVIGEIAAGTPIFTESNFSEWSGLFDSNFDFGQIIAIRVEGDSMEPAIHNGSLAYIKMTKDVLPGQVGAFLINGAATLKKMMRINKESVVLRSINPIYDDIVVNKDDSFEIVGPLVTVQFDWSESYAQEYV